MVRSSFPSLNPGGKFPGRWHKLHQKILLAGFVTVGIHQQCRALREIEATSCFEVKLPVSHRCQLQAF
eukprot:5330352-Amphidinium_carterae.1